MDEQRLAAVTLYVALNALLLLGLAYNVGSRRSEQNQLQPGDIGDAELTRAIRAHGNFTEYAPMVLILLIILALLGLRPIWLHIYGVVFTAGRAVGAIGMMRAKHPNGLRFVGNLVTGLALLFGAAAALALAAYQLG